MLKRAHPPVDFEQEAFQIKRQRCSPFKSTPAALFDENENQITPHHQTPHQVGNKRRRASPVSTCRDEYLYTQQDFTQLQQQCNLAIQAYQREVGGKNEQLQRDNAVLHENQEKLTQENKILRTAIVALNRRNEDGEKQLRAASGAVELLQNKIRQLERVNLQLSMQMQQSSCGLQDSRPWDDHNGGGHIY